MSDEIQWKHPKELLKLQKLKLRKQALQERIKGTVAPKESKKDCLNNTSPFESIFSSKKRKNPFAVADTAPKKPKINENVITLADEPTLFQLINQNQRASSSVLLDSPCNNLSGIFTSITVKKQQTSSEKPTGFPWCPIDWTLKKKMRLVSASPFSWSQKLKISEEASGLTSFTRCLDIEQCDSSLDTSPNAKFHQCCLYWQQPNLPWLQLFPRTAVSKNNINGFNLAANENVKTSLYESWTDSFKSLFQLLRTRQCPYFYVCANTFTALFRAAGIFGYTDLHVMVSPTTRGFRHLMQGEDIEFSQPLKHFRVEGEENIKSEDQDEEEGHVEDFLTGLGVNPEDIKHINYTQAKIEHKTECQVDNGDESLVLIEGVEVNAFFNFLINCKSTIAITGALAGVPPTLLAPVAFHGASLNALRVRESKMHLEGDDYFCLELSGPILPTTIHNIFNMNTSSQNITVTFDDLDSTQGFSKVRRKSERKSDGGTSIFGKANLSDCGLNSKILKHFCSSDANVVCNVDSLKFSGESKTYSWS
ncbi:protein downstream neighbor of son homolog [Anthonomus grandis grandis]|uniref:protein downstream neighbor of son homolog n=1 Tax=Anthonomus grandis grandis TaxID=2921223 RepID=UPI0021650996|nr:protein downstream neighbor of son homolog [Anthonomus grandis grandis]